MVRGNKILFVTQIPGNLGIAVPGKEKLLMAKTLTEVDVKKTTSAHSTSAPARDRVEQRRQGSRLILITAPLALAAAGGAAFLVTRRFLQRGAGDRRRI
jgi:hypothetical protein